MKRKLPLITLYISVSSPNCVYGLPLPHITPAGSLNWILLNFQIYVHTHIGTENVLSLPLSLYIHERQRVSTCWFPSALCLRSMHMNSHFTSLNSKTELHPQQHHNSLSQITPHQKTPLQTMFRLIFPITIPQGNGKEELPLGWAQGLQMVFQGDVSLISKVYFFFYNKNVLV